MVNEKKLGHIATKALALLAGCSGGLTMRQMRELLGVTESQEHFNRRVRDIRKFYVLDTFKKGTETFYVLRGRKAAPAPDSGSVSERLRAEVIHSAHGRCQMCGLTIAEDAIKLQADHKIPQSWGGKTERSNLWAICEPCNRGKKNYFSSFDEKEMKAVLSFTSVHDRIANILKMHIGKPVPSYLIEFVANATEQQDDWQKRLRDLRYPVIGLKIEVSKKKNNKGVQSFYTLLNWKDLPANHRQLIRKYENRKKTIKP